MGTQIFYIVSVKHQGGYKVWPIMDKDKALCLFAALTMQNRSPLLQTVEFDVSPDDKLLPAYRFICWGIA